MPIPELFNNDNSNNVPDDADQSSASQENETVGDNLPSDDSTDESQCDDTNQSDPGQNPYLDLFDNPLEDEILHSEDGNDESDPLCIDTAQFEIKQEHLDLIENHAGNSDDIDKLLQDESGEAVNTEIQDVITENGTGVTEAATSEQLIEEQLYLYNRSCIYHRWQVRYSKAKRNAF